jgi:hypothetical protein
MWASSPDFASLDPSGVTSIVGHSIKGVALIGGTVSKRGPYAMNVGYLKSANEKLFGPKGLSVQIMDTKNLPMELGLQPDAPINLPLGPATMSRGQKGKAALIFSQPWTPLTASYVLLQATFRAYLYMGPQR